MMIRIHFASALTLLGLEDGDNASSEYMLSHYRATSIINEIKVAMKAWQTQARRLGIHQRDFDTFAPRINK